MRRIFIRLRAVAVCLVGLFVAGAASCPSEASEPLACKMAKVAELPVKFDHNRPLVPVEIDGKPGWFLIDTGAQTSTLFGGALVPFGLRSVTADRVTFYGVGGQQAANYAVVQDFRLGDARVKNFRIFVIGAYGSVEEAGILGRDFLGNWDVEFDLAEKVVRLLKFVDCGTRSLAYWTQEPEVADLRHEEPDAPYRVRVLVNGHAIDTMLDSGATTSVVTTAAATLVGARTQDYEAGTVLNAGIGPSAVRTRTAAFDTVVIGDEKIGHARLQVANLFGDVREVETGSILAHPVESRDMPGMLLGADFLRSHRVLLAPGQKRLYFTYAGGSVFQVIGDAVAKTSAGSAPPAAAAAK